ncbi:ankyrin repeat domain-containing protein [Aspergillus mulundensis]|uniref:Uncharacterized protein n=1 Tax=Aspergillus mulundensis TaxID=1810919 RepID=A0A3D8SCM9_9EURO|nr:hypothetical protein DSM5745_04438 [Aspergillus mulundensis]RDW84112.1 hypothetical protein DSM5745_04438 [Aspergillus mulundensis]
MPAAEDAIRAVSAMATQLGNKISVHMLDLISTTTDLPHGFRDLSATFLDTCRTLWAIEGGITELASANRALPEIVTAEVEKKFIAAYTDFQHLEKLILKLVQYEHRGTWGKLQRGLHRPGQELARIHESLKGINEALTISGMAFHWEMGEARPEESVGIGYASLAAALDRIAKGRSAMAVNKVERMSHSQSQSTASTRSSSTPSVPPKDSPSHSHTRSAHVQVAVEHEQFSHDDPIADDTSSILSLNGFLVSNSTRGSERSASIERHSRPQPPSVKTPSATTSRESYGRQHEFVSKPNISNTQLNALNLRESLRSAIRARNHGLLEQLLTNGVSPDKEDDFHPLAEAITQHDPESTRILLQYKADPNQNPDNSTLLIQAIRDRAPPPLLTLLLSATADPNRKDNVGKTPLCEAVQTNQPTLVSTLLDHAANPNLPGPEHALWSGIHHPNCLRILLARGADVTKAPGLMEQATSANNIDAVRVLLEAGISPNTKKDGVYTPLCSAIRDDRPDLVSLLLSHNADPNLKASEYPAWKCITHNRLHFLDPLLAAGADLHNPPGIAECAVQMNNIAALAWLATHNVDMNARNDRGHTPLTTALRENRTEILSWLLDHGADPTLRGEDWPLYMATKSPSLLRLLLPHIDPAHLSQHKGVLERAVRENQLGSVQLLLDAGASPSWKAGGVFSPLTTALRERYKDIVAYLLDNGADVNEPGEHLPLVKAIRRLEGGDLSMVRLLLERGADPNLCYRGWSAVMQAVEDRDSGVLGVLVRGRRVDLGQTDDGGRSVLEMAEGAGWEEGVRMLKGAKGL